MCRSPHPRFLAQGPLSQAREAQASSSSKSVTTGAELLAKGQVGVQKRDTSSPAPISPPLLGSSPCPIQGCATRGQRPPHSASRPGRRASLTPACALPAAPRHPPERPGGSLPTFPGAAGEAAALAATGPGIAWGEGVATASRHIPGASSDPALAQHQTPRARGPAPRRPLTRGGSRGGLRCSPVAAATAAAAAALREGSGRGGWVEDATTD